MGTLNKLQVRELIHDFIKRNPDRPKSFIVNHFFLMGVAKSTIYDVVKRVEEGKPMEHTGPGKAVTKMTEEKKRKVIRAVKNKVGVSQRLLARRFGCSRSLIQKVLKEADITYKRRQKAPKVTLKQAMVQKTRIRNLSRGPLCASKPVDVVMDDESYFTYSGSQMPGNVGFYAGPAGDAPEHVKFKPTMKFPKRVMVWLAMSPRGLSSPVFQKKSQTVDGDFYREKIIKKELVPFLREKYPENDFIFWPDLATAHYARATTQLLDDLDIPFVYKEDNPPNVPQLRPIEDMWGIIKQEVYRGGWSATTEDQLIRRIRSAIRSLDPEVPRKMMAHLPQRVRSAARHGASSAVH